MHAFIASQAQGIFLRQAREGTQCLQNRTARSILEGVPVAIKDEIDMLPYPRSGRSSWVNSQPPPVARGSPPAGGCGLGQYARNWHQPHRATTGRIANPHDLELRCRWQLQRLRGSRGCWPGAGRHRADGVRRCGVVGSNRPSGGSPSAGLLPCAGIEPAGHLGPLGASVEDVAITYAVIAGPDLAEPLTLQQPPVSPPGRGRPPVPTGRADRRLPGVVACGAQELVEANEKRPCRIPKTRCGTGGNHNPQLDAMRIAHAVTI